MQRVDAESETDAGPRDRSAAPQRLCIATRTVKPVDQMLRFVVDPGGAVVPDLKHRLPGRGVWVTARREALGTAVARKAFARGFKRAVQAGADLVGTTENLLERAAADALGIANKAGLVVTGIMKVEATLARGRVIAILQASEAAPDGVRKVAGAARRATGETDPLPVLAFPGTQLDLALGRSNVIHAALLAGPASEAMLARYRRLEEFRGGEPAKLAEECE